MAELSLTLPIFLASSSDVVEERDVAEAEILALAREASSQRLLLQPFRWEIDHFPVAGRPQDALNDELLKAELVVVMIWSRLGEGLAEELVRALAQADRGQTDNVAIYFKTAAPPTSASSEQLAGVRSIRAELQQKKLALTWDFETSEEFRSRFRSALRHWLHRWDNVAVTCEYALQYSTVMKVPVPGDMLLGAVEREWDIRRRAALCAYLGSHAVSQYQCFGMEALGYPMRESEISRIDADWRKLAGATSFGRQVLGPPLRIDEKGDIYYSNEHWFHFFCAAGLVTAIEHDQVEAVTERPYINSIHQCLAAIVEKDRKRGSLARILIRWLSNEDGATAGLPIARNFAAYVLGMIGAKESQDALAGALREDNGEDVDIYCITSLGKLRARRHVPLLTRLFQRESAPGKRLLISQAICRIIGIARYEL